MASPDPSDLLNLIDELMVDLMAGGIPIWFPIREQFEADSRMQ
jgi:hypothetical protein